MIKTRVWNAIFVEDLLGCVCCWIFFAFHFLLQPTRHSPLLLISVELHFLIRYNHPFSTRTLLKLFRWTHWCRFPGRFVAGLIGIDDGNLNARRPSRLRPAAGAVRTRRGPRGSNRSQPADSIMAECGPFSTCKWVDSPADIGGPPAPRPPPFPSSRLRHLKASTGEPIRADGRFRSMRRGRPGWNGASALIQWHGNESAESSHQYGYHGNQRGVGWRGWREWVFAIDLIDAHH